MDIYERMSSTGVLPVIKIDNAKDAVPLAKALKNGGLACAEVTFRTDAAEESIKLIRKNFPEFFIAAGTVLTPEQADKAMAAGADMIVAPGFNPTVVKHCLAKGYPMVPGVCTPSEVEAAMELGLRYLKFFPAENAGGVAFIKAICAPYRAVKFMPTGGLKPSNLGDYLRCKAVFCCGGSWMVPADKITNGNFDEIEALTKEAVALVAQIKAENK